MAKVPEGLTIRPTTSVRRISPLSAFKLTLAMSLVGLVVWLIAVAVLYLGMSAAGVWSQVNALVGDIGGDQIISFGLVFGVALVVGLVGVVISAVLAPIGAVIYNAVAHFLGGLEIETDKVVYDDARPAPARERPMAPAAPVEHQPAPTALTAAAPVADLADPPVERPERTERSAAPEPSDRADHPLPYSVKSQSIPSESDTSIHLPKITPAHVPSRSATSERPSASLLSPEGRPAGGSTAASERFGNREPEQPITLGGYTLNRPTRDAEPPRQEERRKLPTKPAPPKPEQPTTGQHPQARLVPSLGDKPDNTPTPPVEEPTAVQPVPAAPAEPAEDTAKPERGLRPIPQQSKLRGMGYRPARPITDSHAAVRAGDTTGDGKPRVPLKPEPIKLPNLEDVRRAQREKRERERQEQVAKAAEAAAVDAAAEPTAPVEDEAAPIAEAAPTAPETVDESQQVPADADAAVDGDVADIDGAREPDDVQPLARAPQLSEPAPVAAEEDHDLAAEALEPAADAVAEAPAAADDDGEAHDGQDQENELVANTDTAPEAAEKAAESPGERS